IAFTKTETVQVALFSAVILSEPVSPGGFLAIIVGMLGVILLSWPRGGALSGAFLNRTLAIGLAAGAAFAVSAIAYRAATLSLGGGGHVFRATVTLACVSTLQTLLSAALLAGFEPKTLGQVARSWRATFSVGLTGMR